MKDREIKEFILNELSKFEFKKYTQGFKYLNEAIYICIKDINSLDNLTKYVFPKIGRKYNKSWLKVKWCMEQVIQTMYNNTSMDVLCSYFNIDSNMKISLKFIIYTVVCKYENYLYKNNLI